MHRATILLLLIAVVAAFWQNAGPAAADRLHTVTLAVKHRANAAATCNSLLMEVSEPGSPKYGKHKTLAEVNSIIMDVEAVKRVEDFLTAQGVTFVTVGDYIKVTAKVSELETIFNAKFNTFNHAKLGRTALKADNFVLPREIVNDIDVVLNTDIPRVVPHHIMSTSMAANPPITTPQLINKVYGIKNNTVTQATQSLFEGLGQNFSPDDLAQFQQLLRLPNVPIEKVTGNNDGGDCALNPNACGEANLDVQYMIAVAQSTQTHYRVIDQSSQDPFYDWIIDLSQTQSPAYVHSVSYGSLAPEDPKNDMLRFNTETCKLGLRGVTIVVASGDDGVANFPARQDSSKCGFVPSFPATSPYVVAVGATQGPEAGKSEIACTSDAGGLITTGGGFSVTFKRPSYQDKAVKNYFAIAQNLPDTSDFASNGRGYPDVSAMGHNYIIVDGGQQTAVSGTSASAPVFAAILTLINDQRLNNGQSTLGFVNPALYKAPSAVFNDITEGRNNCAAGQAGQQVCCEEGFTAAKGWDPLTGLGTPRFPKLSAYLARL